jgi:hypothetical protein
MGYLAGAVGVAVGCADGLVQPLIIRTATMAVIETIMIQFLFDSMQIPQFNLS